MDENSSFSLSLTPSPVSEQENSSISEHIDENDRSLPEIDVNPLDFTSVNISQEDEPPGMDTSGCVNVKSILDEILNNEQFKSESEEESLNIFANIDLDDKNLYLERISGLEEVIAVKDSTIAALNNEIDTYRSNSFSTSTTDYKQLHDECQNKLMEFSDVIVHKDDLIQKLTESLHESIKKREELEENNDKFKEEILQLQKQLEETTDLIKKHNCSKIIDFNFESQNFENNLNLEQISQFNTLKLAIDQKINDNKRIYQNEVDNLKIKLENDKLIYLAEQKELEEKHGKEMEELRTYFEKKCADLEKNYSEEIFSQQSRKLSSSDSETDLPIDNLPGLASDCNLEQEKLNKLKDDLKVLLKTLDKNDLSYENLMKKELYNNELISLIRNDLKNQYNAELEILREDFDNRIDLIHLEYNQKEEKLLSEIDLLKNQMNSQICPVVQEAISGDFEIDEVVQSYERRLQEQINLAKIDIISALENQIEYLSNCDNFDDNWPNELIKLKEKFEEKYKIQCEKYENEIIRLKKRQLNNNDLEREEMKKQIMNLRNLINKLLKYFNKCENELNSTLIEELLKCELNDRDLSLIESELIENKRRVHLTPNYNDLLIFLEENDLESIDLNLDKNLEKLKQEANEILLLTSNLKINPKQDLVNLLENEKIQLELQLKDSLNKQHILQVELLKSKQKIVELIENKDIIISMGYGENGTNSNTNFNNLNEAVNILQQLQEKSRNITVNAKNSDQELVHLIEELQKLAERIVEEAKKEKDDLNLQIEVANKKYKTTCQFLEEQANEREQERDEAQKEINLLKEHLKERDKDRINNERFNNEIENLEQQIRDLTKLVKEQDRKLEECNEEHKEAIDKIYDLREIIRNLEQQIDIKTNNEVKLNNVIKELENCINPEKQQQTKVNENGLNDLKQYINNLENQLENLKLSNDLSNNFDNDTIKQINNLLNEFEITIDKKTKDLEGLHSTLSTTCCSSPSEDMSIRDVVNSSMHPKMVLNDCELPLQQLSRLKEKLQRHSRAEDAAVKRINDLEMQLYTLKNELDENQTEKEILKKQINDQLVLISSLQIRLDDQRIRVEHIEKQTNTSLESRIYDLENEILLLEEKLQSKEKLINQLNKNLQDTKKRLIQQENDLKQTTNDQLLFDLQKQLQLLQNENEQLKTNQILPNFIESIISDKNANIKLLKEQLQTSENQLKFYANNKTINEIEPIRHLSETNYEENLITIPFKNSKQINDTTIFEDTFEPKKNSTELIKFEKHVHFQDNNDLINDLKLKTNEIEQLKKKLNQIKQLEEKIENLQANLETTENQLKQTNELFQNEMEQLKNNENTQKLELKEKTDKIEQLIRERIEMDKQREQDLIKFNKQLERNEENLQQLKVNEKIQNEKCKEIERLIQERNQINRQREEELIKLNKQIEINKENELKLNELNNELINNRYLIEEKEKIIIQMTIDSKSLHQNLETIQSKIQETGNLIDLAKKLKDEQKKNLELYNELHNLKAQLFFYENTTTNIDEITEKVEKELNYGNYLDKSLINAINKQDINEIKTINDKLTMELNDLKNNYEKLKFNDNNLIKELQLKLNYLLQRENELKLLLENERKLRSDEDLTTTEYKEIQKRDWKNELDKLKIEYNLLCESKEEIEANLQYTKDLLELKCEELRSFNGKLMEKNEILERFFNENLQLKNDLKDKLNELENSRLLIEDIEQDRFLLKEQNRKLMENKGNDENISKKMSEKIREIKENLNDDKKMIDIIKRLTNEKKMLESRIVSMETEPIERSNYMFAKYLRADSYRKALIFQKRYLNTMVKIKIKEKRNCNRFKIVGILLISISRMQYLVNRWHTGRRILSNGDNKRNVVNFQVGQPVSSENFNCSTQETSWSGNSPPVKEVARIGSEQALLTPRLLSKYMDRFNQMEEMLGIVQD